MAAVLLIFLRINWPHLLH